MIKFNSIYFYCTVLLFLIEVCIATFFTDRFVRPFVGDVLVVMLIYCFVRSFWTVRVVPLALAIFAFACAIEGLQYLNIVDHLGLRPYKLLVIILGASFDWNDILAYALGTAIVLWRET
jgi:Protein of unknown function (DUF2809)